MPKVQLQTAVLAYLAYVDQIAFNTSESIMHTCVYIIVSVCV